ncbi:expressed unknown protein [Seminavis robusta]|uniref:Glycosyltransferase family 92 protein n=1 Tax=Seminavis robusta TaxID=568900 RepID=A0A9N8D8K2_9STRA|nr:expressed unknown protein [Seminavis robusta]|eukprot:Sro31_g020390.1 n/a (591) ;mRNA; r:117492-119264
MGRLVILLGVVVVISIGTISSHLAPPFLEVMREDLQRNATILPKDDNNDVDATKTQEEFGISSKSSSSFLLHKDNDNHRIPGPFMNDKLYFLGIRLTTSYDHSDESVFVDLFGHGVGQGSNGAFHVAKQDPGSALSFQNATKQQLFCQVVSYNKGDTDDPTANRVEMEYIPNVSVDPNTQGTHLIWRCDVSAYLSRSVLVEQPHARINVYTNLGNPYHPNPNTPIMTVDIPTDTASIGHAGPTIKNPHTSFLKQPPVGVVLCVSGVKESATWYLPEYLQHHISVGVDHIFFGADSPEDLEPLQTALAYYIDKGLVVLGSEAPLKLNRQVRKLRFYNQCLFHAKSISEFAVVWDIDELWMPPRPQDLGERRRRRRLLENTTTVTGKRRRRRLEDSTTTTKPQHDNPYQSTIKIVDAIRNVTGGLGCSNWCYQSFPSYTVNRIVPRKDNATHPEYKGFYGFPNRDKDLNQMWKKPILRTKYNFQTSFHVGGSCYRPESKIPIGARQKYLPQFPECRMQELTVPKWGRMHHYHKLFRPDWGLDDVTKFPDLDEYTQHFRPTIIQQLLQLQGKVNSTASFPAVEDERLREYGVQ